MKHKLAIGTFVKTPGVSPLKTRLAAGIGEDAALEFYRLSLACITATLTELQQTYPQIEPFWAVAEEGALKNSLWSDFSVVGQGHGELGSRLATVFEALYAKFDGVVFIGADSPQLTTSLLTRAADTLVNQEKDFVIGPATDGGYYLLGANRAISRAIFESIPYSSDQTCRAMLHKLEPVGSLLTLETQFDVDTVDDLGVLADYLAKQDTLSHNQKLLREWLSDNKL